MDHQLVRDLARTMYTGYFGFTKPPFTGADAYELLANPAYETAYACLNQALREQRRGLVLLTGDAGIGKTTLLRQLMRELENQVHCIFCWNAYLGFDDLLNYLCNELDLRASGSGRTQKMEALEIYLISRLMESRKVILVLDDAHNLLEETLEGLQALVRMETAGQRLLQIVLSGQPSLETRMLKEPARRPLAHDIGRRCRFATLTDQEALLYIENRLRAAGYQGDGLFETDALRKIISYARGVPRLINLICNQSLLLAYLNSERQVRASMIREVAANSHLQERSSATPPVEPITAIPPPPVPPLEPITAASAIPSEHPPAILVERGVTPHHLHARHHRRLVIGLFFLAMIGTAVAVHYMNPEWLSRLLSSTFQNTVSDKPNTIPDKPAADTAPLDLPKLPGTIATEAVFTPTILDATVAEGIKALLNEADQQIEVSQYTLPAGESTLDSYREVLQLDPDNREALQGIERIKTSFVLWSESAQARGDLAKAEDYLETALAIDPDDKAVRARLDKIRRERANMNAAAR